MILGRRFLSLLLGQVQRSVCPTLLLRNSQESEIHSRSDEYVRSHLRNHLSRVHVDEVHLASATMLHTAVVLQCAGLLT